MESKANWFTVDEATLSAGLKKLLAEKRKHDEAAAKAKQAFEAEFLKAARAAGRIDAEVNLAFGYRFGKVAVAKVEGEAKPATSSKPKFSF